MQQSIAPAPVPQSIQADNDLRAQLAASLGHGAHAPHGYGNSDVPASSSASPHDHNIDPAIGGGPGGPSGMMSNVGGGDSGGDDSIGDGSKRGGKRELSSSKRAAQNRAAQRAFRQRKEGYIKKLEEQVRDLHSLEDNFKAVQAENYSLREYIIHLQSRLIESQGDYPQPPANVNLTHPHARGQQQQHHDLVAHNSSGVGVVAPLAPMSQLQASAARALQSGGNNKHEVAEEQNDEEIIRSQLQASNDGLPGPL